MDIAIASIMLFAIMPIYGVGFHISLIMLLPLVLLTALTAAALGIWTAALNVNTVTSAMLCHCDSDADVSHTRHLSGQLFSRALAMVTQAQPS